MTTSTQGSYQNAHEQIIPFHIFKQLELRAVLKSLLPRRTRGLR